MNKLHIKALTMYHALCDFPEEVGSINTELIGRIRYPSFSSNDEKIVLFIDIEGSYVRRR